MLLLRNFTGSRMLSEEKDKSIATVFHDLFMKKGGLDMVRNGSENVIKVRKPFYMRWWFWGIIVIILLTGLPTKSSKAESVEHDAVEAAREAFEEKVKDDHVYFSKNVWNDKTGRWRKTQYASMVPIHDAAVEYYRAYFGDDNEIHAVINYTLNTTAKITSQGDYIQIETYERVDKEEYDVKTLFSGMYIGSSTINKATGEDMSDEFKTVAQNDDPEAFLADVWNAIKDGVGSGEAVTRMVLEDKDLQIYVDLGDDSGMFTFEDTAILRTISFTDRILELAQYDNLWDTITLDFGDVGKVVNYKSGIETCGAGRYFNIDSNALQK